MTEFVVGESVLIDESLSDYEAMRVFFDVADERGHLAPSVVIDDRAKALTHRDYSDRVAVVHEGAAVWAFCRRPLPETLGLLEGTGWVREVVPHLLIDDRSPYPMDPFFQYQPYIQRFGSDKPIMLPPVTSAATLAIAPDGSRLAVLDERDGGDHALWEYELGMGTRRLVATFPPGSDILFAELSYGPDGRWLLLCASGRCLLVRVSDGLIVTLPVHAEAASWNPRNGPNALILMVTDRQSGSVDIQDYDLATGAAHHRSTLLPRGGRPLNVRELSLSADERALAIAPVGAVGFDQAARGGVWAVAVVDIDRGTIDPILSASFKTQHASRRHSCPRWCEDPYPVTGLTTPAEKLLATCTVARIEAGRPIDRWLPILSGITRSWATGAAPVGTLAQELVQYSIDCGDRAADALSRLADLGRGHATPRTVEKRIADGRRLWDPIAAEPPVSVDMTLPTMPSGVGNLIAATTTADIVRAARDLVSEVTGNPWAWLAKHSTQALWAADYRCAALIALCAIRWNVDHISSDWSVRSYGLDSTPRDLAVAIYLNGFEACTHLPERTELARVDDELYDVESVRNACQRRLQHLPLASHLGSSVRPRQRRGEPTVIGRPRSNESSEGANGPVGKVFISYQRDDLPLVEPIVAQLRLAGIDLWMDIVDLLPGGDFRIAIKRAIRSGGAFVPFFSPRYVSRRSTYMNVELREAIDQARLMHVGATWLIPIMLEPCEIPDMIIDGTTDLANLHYIDFPADWNAAMDALIRVLKTILSP